jgi:SNF2 family DNA or RNA helicase
MSSPSSPSSPSSSASAASSSPAGFSADSGGSSGGGGHAGDDDDDNDNNDDNDGNQEAGAEGQEEGDEDEDEDDREAHEWKRLNNLLMQLRKVCNHPFSLPGSEPAFDGESTGEAIVQASGKLVVLDKLLAKLKAAGHRVVLFSQFVMILDILEDYMKLRG